MTDDMNREDEVFHALSAMPAAVRQVYADTDPQCYAIIMRTLTDWKAERAWIARKEAKAEMDRALEKMWEMKAEDEEQNIPDKE